MCIWGVYQRSVFAVEAVEGVVDSVTSNSQFQYPNMAGVAIIDNYLVSRGEDEALGACGSNKEAVCRVPVRFSGQESALGS